MTPSFFVRFPVLSDELNFCVVFDSGNEKSAAVGDVLKPVQIMVSLIKGVDAVRNHDDVLPCRSNIRHFPIAQHDKAGQIAG